MGNFVKVKGTILEFENGKISMDDALKVINELVETKVSAYDLENYWKSRDIDSFVDLITSEVYPDWESIDDQRAIELLKVMVEAPDDELIFQKYSVALEKRYGKSEGTISDLIFHDDILDPSDLLNKLKTDDRILL